MVQLADEAELTPYSKDMMACGKEAVRAILRQQVSPNRCTERRAGKWEPPNAFSVHHSLQLVIIPMIWTHTKLGPSLYLIRSSASNVCTPNARGLHFLPKSLWLIHLQNESVQLGKLSPKRQTRDWFDDERQCY